MSEEAEYNAVCNDDGHQVLITKLQTTACEQPEKRVVSNSIGWTCSDSKTCKNLNCLGHGKAGKSKNWIHDPK